MADVCANEIDSACAPFTPLPCMLHTGIKASVDCSISSSVIFSLDQAAAMSPETILVASGSINRSNGCNVIVSKLKRGVFGATSSSSPASLMRVDMICLSTVKNKSRKTLVTLVEGGAIMYDCVYRTVTPSQGNDVL